MPNATTTSRHGRVLLFFAAGALVILLLAGPFFWQRELHNSRVDDASGQATASAELTRTDEEAGIAATMLQQYVRTGDASSIPAIKSHITSAVENLTGALTISGDQDLRSLAMDGTALAQTASQAVALREAGDVAGAAQTLQALDPKFKSMKTTVLAAAKSQMDKASASEASAETAQNTANAFLIACLAAAGVYAFALLFVIGRSLLRRQESKGASPA